jgi:4-hydroxybenzoate polyprenyltransferase/GT2 family glycosyltransferase
MTPVDGQAAGSAGSAGSGSAGSGGSGPAGSGTRFGAGDLLRSSRPVSWINTGLPFLAAAFEETRELTPLVLLGTLYFLVPYNLLLYGVNDLFDYASDVRNPRKQSLEGGLVAPGHARRLWLAVVATNVPILAALAWLAGPVPAAALLITVGVALAYSAPPLRTKVRPFLDSTTSALHFVLPAVCGFLVAGRALDELPWLMLLGFLAWGIASHAVGAIQDIRYDRAAGIGSIATALGGRGTAQVALAGYAVAVAAALTLPAPWNIVVAITLAPYLLLPVMVLARDDEGQARAAWRSFMGLNIPAGFVLSHALLRHWEVTTFDPWELGVWVATGAAGWVLLNTLLTRWATRRRADRHRPPARPSPHGRPPASDPASRPEPGSPLPSLTILVPCRDEADRLPATLAALAAQRYPGLRVIVADDGSTDGTASIATDALAPLGERARVVAVPPAPAGWSGKSWAVDSTIGLADTELVLALDADTVLEPDAAAVLVRELLATDADLLSGVTRYAMTGLDEQASMPGYPLLLFGFVPVWLSALTGGRPPAVAFAYGPLQLVRRAAYAAAGGHGAVPASHRDDVDLAWTFARHGLRVHTTYAADLGTTRHYRNGAEVRASWSRILPGYAGGSLAVALLTVTGEMLAFGLPLVLPVAAAILAPDRLMASLVPLAILVAARLVLAMTQRQPLVTVLLHPATLVVTIAAQLTAIREMVLGRTASWRGRSMPSPPTHRPAAAGANPAPDAGSAGREVPNTTGASR